MNEHEVGGSVPEESGPEATQDRGAGLHRRLVQTLVSPGELFRALAARPVALGALLLGAVLVALGNLAIPLELLEAATREQLLEAGRDVPMDPAAMARIGKVASVLGALIAWPLLAVVAAGIYALVFLFLFGYRGSYREYLAVTAHAFLIPALAALVLVPLRIAAEDPTFSLSMANFFFFLEEGFATRFLGFLDLFSLWSYVLIGVGAAVVDGSRGIGHGIGVAVGTAALFFLGVAFVATALGG